MEQLNRGIKVEGLTLPPGITLTRVDPSMAEAVKAKKESIGRVSFPFFLVKVLRKFKASLAAVHSNFDSTASG